MPSEKVRVGVLTNPTALHNHRFPFTHGRLIRHLESTADAVVTADKSRIEGAIGHLLLERDVNVLAINGGDGTIHLALNSMAAVMPATGKRYPILLLLNGGTYNMASRAMGTKGDPVRTISGFIERNRGKSAGEVRTRRMGLLSIRPANMTPMLGLVFGSQVVANALELCDRLGSGYLGLAMLLARGVMGQVLTTRFYLENMWRLRPQDTTIRLDGEAIEGVIGAVASTIDLKLARGLVWALTTEVGGQGFHAKVVRAKTAAEVVRLLPHLLWEISHPMVVTRPEARRLHVSGNFTVDGELYDHSGAVEVEASAIGFDVVCGEDL